MSTTPLPHTATSCHGRSLARRSFAHRLSARFGTNANSFDDDPDPFSDEPWDPDEMEFDEPQPEPGDFWPEIDDD